MNCCKKASNKIKEFFMKGLKNQRTGSYLNYYLMYMKDEGLRKVLNEKYTENFDLLYWPVLPL